MVFSLIRFTSLYLQNMWSIILYIFFQKTKQREKRGGNATVIIFILFLSLLASAFLKPAGKNKQQDKKPGCPQGKQVNAQGN